MQGQKAATAAANKMAADVGKAAGDTEKAQSAASEKARKTAEIEAKKVESANAKAAESFANIGRKALELYAIFTAGRGIKEFISDITASDAATGRLAKNIDLSGKSLSAWEGAATAAGGSADGLAGFFQSLTGQMQTASLTGQSSVLPYFRALGINLADASGKARSMTDIMFDLNRKAQGMDPARFSAMMHGIGADDGTINLLELTTDEFRKLYLEQQKYAATAADIEAAQKRQTGWRELLIISTSLGRTILTALTPAITGVMDAVKGWAAANGEWLKNQIVEKVGEFITWLRSVDWQKVGSDFKTFAENVGAVAVAFATLVGSVSGQSPLVVAFEAFGVLLALRVLAPLRGVVAAISMLGTMSLPSWVASLLGIAAPAAAAAALVATTSPLNAGEPTTTPDGRLHYPDGHSEQGHVWDGHSKGAAPADTRNWWQRTAPKWAGGQDAPMVAHGAHGASLRERRGTIDDNVYPTGPIDADKLNWSSMSKDKAAKRLVLARYAKSLGLPDEGAAGMVGHAEVESNFKTDAHNGRLEDSTGLFQLNDSAAAGHRHSKYLAWAQEHNRAPTDYKSQMDYAKYEAQRLPGPNGGSLWDGMQHAGSVSEANKLWMDHFENPKFKDYSNREMYGQKAYAALKSHPMPIETATAPIGGAVAAVAQATSVSRAPTASASPLSHPTSHTYDSAANSLFAAYHASSHRGPSGPITVQLTDASAEKVGDHTGRAMLGDRYRAAVSARSAATTRHLFDGTSWNGLGDSHSHLAGMGSRVAAMQQSARGGTTHNVSNSSESHVGELHVHTQATDASGIVADIQPALRRSSLVTQANTGLA